MSESFSLRQRLERDFHLALVLVVAGLMVLFVAPFATYRAVEGRWLVAVVDVVLIVGAGGIAWYGWYSGRSRLAGMILAVFLACGTVAVTAIVGWNGALWVFPLILVVFYFFPPPAALAVAASVLVMIAVIDAVGSRAVFASPDRMLSYFSAGIGTAMVGFLFALKSYSQHARLMQWATRDPLTGLYNRRAMEDAIDQALAMFHHEEVRCGLLVVDVDDFKVVNDRCGHGEGDRVLRDIAHIVTGSIRRTDQAFRYGGDEFVLILPDTDVHGLRRVAEAIVARACDTLCGEKMTATLSVGGALLRKGDSRESWNRRADRCLYEAKNRGKNTVVVDGLGSDGFESDGRTS